MKKVKSIFAFILAFIISIGAISQNLHEVHAETSNDYGVVGAYEAYSVAENLYEQGKKLKTGNEMIYIRSNPKGGSKEKGEIAYCFNADRSVPDLKSGAPDYIGENYPENTLITYTKIAGTENKFSSLATKARDNARKDILKVVYNGFRDGAGNRVNEIKEAFKIKYPNIADGNISDAEIYAATQKAVWYYTDSSELVKEIPKKATITGEEIDATMNTKTWYVYQFLLGQSLTDDNPLNGKTLKDIPENNTLDLYQPTRLHESHSKGYQNLLSCKFVSSNRETNYIEHEVKILKIDKADKSVIEGARLKLEAINSAITGQRIFMWTTKANGGLNPTTFKLPAGEYLLTELKAPTRYKLAEPITIKVSDKGEIKYSSKNQNEVTANDKTVVMEDEKIPTMTVNVNKEWKDKNNATPSNLEFLSAKVKLLADGKDAVDASGHIVPEQFLNKMSGWKASFTNLPIYKDGNTSGEKIVYSVSESEMNSSYKLVQGGDTKVSGDADRDKKEIKLVNKEIDTPKPVEPVVITKVQVNKKWSNQDKKSTKNIYFELWKVKDGKESIVTLDDFLIKPKAFQARQQLPSNGTMVIWDKLYLKEQGYTFKVKEVDEKGNPWNDKANGYKEDSYKIDSTVDKLKQLLVVNITNNYEEIPKTKVTFSKKALTENGEELAGAKIKLTKKDGTVVKEWETDGKLREFELEEGSYTFTEVSAPDKYQVATSITFEVKDGKVLVTGTEVKGNTIVMVDKLKEVPKTKVAVKKLWAGLKLKSCTVRLYADDEEIYSIVLNEGNGWKHTFTNLRKFNSDGKEIKYTVKEEVPKGYKAKYHGDMEKGFSIINTQDVTDITATKKWEGGPSEKPTVWFKLYRNIEGEEAKPVERLPEQPLHNGDTSVTWSKLPKTNDEGKEYVYSVKEGELKDGVFTEKAPKNYIKTENGLTVTNKYSSPKIDIKGKKVWENEGEKPTVKLQLFKNGQAEGNPVELKDGKTEHIWKNLPKTDKDGKDYEYTIKEVDEVNGHIKIGNTWYKVTYEGNTQTGFTIKNKKLSPLTPMEPPTRDIKVVKNWELLGTEKPVEKIEVELYQNGNPTGKKLELNTSNNWSGEFKKLPVSKELETEKYKYTIKEIGETSNSIKLNGKWFKVTYEGSMKDGFKITNKELLPYIPMIPPTRDIKVVKNWELLGTEKPVEKIEVELYQNGNPTGKKLELTKDNNWSGEFKNLEVADKLGSINYYNYTVKEVGENTGSIKFGNAWFKVSYEGSMKDGFKITNKELPPYIPMIPPTRDIKVVKNWELLGTEKPVEKIEVELYKDGVATGKKLELTKDNNWSGEFKKLEVADKLGSINYYNYTVKEVGENAGSIKFGNAWFKVIYEGSMKDGFKITNKELLPYTPMIPPTRDIKVVKNWELLGTEKPVEKIEVELYKDGVATGKKLELTKDNNWSGEFKNLEVADKLGSTNYYNYTVKEVGENAGSIKFGNVWFKVSYEGSMKDGFKITNKELLPYIPMIPPTRDIKVTKLWKDHNGSTIAAPTDKIIVELYKDGVATGKKLELTKDNNWSGEFKKLEVADKLGSTNYYNYTVKEVGENAGSIKFGNAWFKVIYEGSMKDGFKITNKELLPYTPMIPPTRDIKVVKNWELLGTEKPVEKIEVELYKDGVAIGKKLELTKDNNWSGEFKNLEVADKLGSTNYYNYTVKEVGENAGSIKFGNAWFKVNYEGSMKDGFKITNKELLPYIPMIPPTRDIKVTKLWKDHNGSTIAAPTDKIIVELYKDGVATGKKLELTKDNNWSGEFKNLEVADKLGSTNYYNYTVKEVGENGNIIKIDTNQYKVIYGGSMKDGITITNEKEIPPVPPTPEKPNKPTPPEPEKPVVPKEGKATLPKTGDGTNIYVYAWAILLSGIALILIGYRRRKHTK